MRRWLLNLNNYPRTWRKSKTLKEMLRDSQNARSRFAHLKSIRGQIVLMRYNLLLFSSKLIPLLEPTAKEWAHLVDIEANWASSNTCRKNNYLWNKSGNLSQNKEVIPKPRSITNSSLMSLASHQKRNKKTSKIYWMWAAKKTTFRFIRVTAYRLSNWELD